MKSAAVDANPAHGIRIYAMSAILALWLSVVPGLGGQPGDPDPSFNIGSGFDNYVSKVAIQTDGKVLVAGLFEEFSGNAVSGVVRLTTNGTYDTSFKYKDLKLAAVTALKVLNNSQVLLMGTFRLANSGRMERLVRLNSDGTVDRVLAQTAAEDLFEYVEPTPDGAYIVAGRFNRFKGVLRKGIARILGDGTLDESFNPGINFGDYYPDSLLLLPDGDLLVNEVLWAPRGDSSTGMIRLRSDGSLNPILPKFASSGSKPFLAWDGSIVIRNFSSFPFQHIRADGWIYPSYGLGVKLYPEHLLSLSDGRNLVVVRNSTGEGGEVFRLFADGSVDSSFHLLFEHGLVDSAAEGPDGNYWLAGSFFSINGEFVDAVVKISAGDQQGIERIRFHGSQFGVFEDDGKARIPVLRLGDATGRSEVQFKTTGQGTATAGEDFTPAMGTVVFQPGQRLASFEVPVLTDSQAEANESAGLELSGTFVDQSGNTGEIRIASTLGVVEFAVPAVTVGESDSTPFLQVVRAGGPMNLFPVGIIVSPGTAGPQDFSFSSTNAYFLAGSPNGSVGFQLPDDQSTQGNREFSVQLGELPIGYRPGKVDSLTVTIRDNDLPGIPGEGISKGADRLWATPDGGVVLSGRFTNIFGARRPGIAKLDADGRLTDIFSDFPSRYSRILDVAKDGRMIVEISTNIIGRSFRFDEQAPIPLLVLDSDGRTLGTYSGTNRTLGAALIPGGGFVRANARPERPGKTGEYWVDFSLIKNDGQLITNHESPLSLLFRYESFLTRTPAMSFTFRPTGDCIVTGSIVYHAKPFDSGVAYLFRLDGNWKLDADYAGGFYYTDMSPNDSDLIRTWSRDEGRILLVGSFGEYNFEPHPGLVQLRANGQADPAFRAEFPVIYRPNSTLANAVDVTATGQILAPWRDGNGYRLLRFHSDGTLDLSFSTHAVAAGTILSVAVVADGRILVSGDFTQFAGLPRARLAWLSSNGDLLPDRPLEIVARKTQSEGRIHLNINSRRAARSLLERSSDLQRWEPVIELGLPAGSFEAAVPSGDSSLEFYRVRFAE